MAWEFLPIYIGVEPPDEDAVDDLVSWPATRSESYDPDLIWTLDDWDGDTYTPSEYAEIEGNYAVAGGGRFGMNMITIAKDLIYYEEFV